MSDTPAIASGDEGDTDLTRERAVRLFRFLIQLKALNSVPVRHLDNYESVISLAGVPDLDGVYSAARSGVSDEGELLIVPRVKLPSRPLLPETLRERFEAESRLEHLEVPVASGAIFSLLTRGDAEAKGVGGTVDLDRCLFKPDLDAAIVGSGKTESSSRDGSALTTRS
jgi:hypothetical protein